MDSISHGARLICGVDEAGRGCLAGPIFGAAVVLDQRRPIPDLADSKRLTPAAREKLFDEICDRALAFGIAFASEREIDDRGIEWANRMVFTRSVKALLRGNRFIDPKQVSVYIDGNRRAYRLGLVQYTIIGGDQIEPAIQAASILAKVSRDRYVLSHLHRSFPQYGFDRHKGYATKQHLLAIKKWGPTPFHRLSFRLPGGQEEAQ